VNGKVKVVVVDDDPTILDLVTTILRLARVDVASAVDGEAGLALAAARMVTQGRSPD
jgi:DNA-binding response OmpR family regulator